VKAFRVALLIASLVLLVDTPAAAVTCGSQRWPVKTGTDADIAQADLTQIVPKTVSDMIALAKPPSRPQANRVTPTETTVFSITAFIVHYKQEPDSDHHLVLDDGSGNTMVAEIPHPGCIQGSTPDAISTGIAQARAAFDGQFDATTKFQDAIPPMPVTITGLGFFDTPSHGTGAPPNGIEIHPVLDIIFNPPGATVTPTATPTPSGPPAPTGSPTPIATIRPAGGRGQLIADPSFEDASSSAWSASDGVLTDSTKRLSHTGARYAWLGGYGKVHTDTLHQEVALPGAASKITLAYWLAIDTKERPSSSEYDLLTVEVRTQSGARLATLAEYSNLDATRGYERRTFNLLPFRGQIVVVWFTADEDQSLQTSFLVDDVSVDIE